MTAIPIVLFWTLALHGLFSRKPMLVYLFFATMPVGAFAVIPTALTGGLTFTPTPVIALLLIARTFSDRDGPAAFLALALLPHRLMLLTLFWAAAAVTTLFMPRLFAGKVMVVPIRGIVSAAAPLQPSAQNVSQFAYLSIAILSVFAFARILRSADIRQHALKAMCLGGGIAVLTGLLDFASQFLPITPALEPFRTASYALLTDIEVLGGKRVVGLMPEASSYGGQCLAFLSALYFYRRAIADSRVREIYVPVVLCLLVVCAWLSTSTGAYVGVAVFFLVAALEWFLRINADERSGAVHRRTLGAETTAAVSLFILIGILAIVQPYIFDPVQSMVQRMILEKQESTSFTERGMWRTVATAALSATHGLGVGLGGTRSSSSVIAIFACTGIIGGLLFYGFVLQCLLRQVADRKPEQRILLSAFRFSFLPTFAISLMVGDAIFGGLTAFGLGLATALSGQTNPRSVRWYDYQSSESSRSNDCLRRSMSQMNA